MKHKIEVVMLPTEDNSYVWRSKANHQLTYSDIPSSFPNLVVKQHTYITVSQDVETIKEGDWFITVQKHLFQCKRVGIHNIFFDQHNDGYEYQAQKERCLKIIATTDQSLMQNGFHTPLPLPQQSFLKEYVANPNGGFEVEYENVEYFDYEYNVQTQIGEHITYLKKELKLNQDNTVNITSVEEKMYGREEVSHLINEAVKAWNYERLDDGSLDLDNWIKENL